MTLYSFTFWKPLACVRAECAVPNHYHQETIHCAVHCLAVHQVNLLLMTLFVD